MPPGDRGLRGALAGSLARWASLLFRQPVDLAIRNPVVLLLVLRVAEELFKRWTIALKFRLGKLRLHSLTDEIDGEIVQGCLLSTEHFLSMGRVEKRTLFSRPLIDVLCGNEYLRRELVAAGRRCHTRSSNCLVPRWLPAHERYHALQAALNQASSMFGPNFVHFNALDGESTNQFKSTWYCITVMTPPKLPKPLDMARLQNEEDNWGRQRSYSMAGDGGDVPEDAPRSRRGTLRIVLVNESELRRIADGKLKPPGWGFFNSRHRDRYRMLQDFAENFRAQLVRTPADSRSASSMNPFTSERAHQLQSVARATPDGGLFKRVHSQPQLSKDGQLNGKSGEDGLGKALPLSKLSQAHGLDVSGKRRNSRAGGEDLQVAKPEEGVEGDDNCFLRLHVPHFVGSPTNVRRPSQPSQSGHAQAMNHLQRRESLESPGALDAMTAVPSEIPCPCPPTPSFGGR